VTMDWPEGTDQPVPLVIETTQQGFVIKKDVASISGSPAIISSQSPRFG
jgi:hypothetical protein